MRPFNYRLGCVTLVGLIMISFAAPVGAHEPLFGLGPHTIYQYGLGLETEVERHEHGFAVNAEAIYGLTPDLAVTLVVPWVRRSEQGLVAQGLGDLSLRAKWRAFRRDFPGGQDALALHAGVQTPTGDDRAVLPLGTGATDVFGGISAARESRRWYYFGDLRYRINRTGTNGLNRGDVFAYDAAWGVRPVRARYDQPDLVLLVEANGTIAGKATRQGITNSDTGGHVLAVSPGFLFSIRNMMVKGGVNIPVLWNLNGVQETPETEIVFGVEFHL